MSVLEKKNVNLNVQSDQKKNVGINNTTKIHNKIYKKINKKCLEVHCLPSIMYIIYIWFIYNLKFKLDQQNIQKSNDGLKCRGSVDQLVSQYFIYLWCYIIVLVTITLLWWYNSFKYLVKKTEKKCLTKFQPVFRLINNEGKHIALKFKFSKIQTELKTLFS